MVVFLYLDRNQDASGSHVFVTAAPSVTPLGNAQLIAKKIMIKLNENNC